jgi:putative spermidine/putrescine transport system ATP-binding protein
MTTPILELQDISFTYPGARSPAIQLNNLKLKLGETLALIGSSGGGKTTVLRLISGLQRVQSGSIRLDGNEIGHLPPQERGMGLVFQTPLLFPFLNTVENVGFGIRSNRELKKHSHKLAMAGLDLVGMADFALRPVQTLSGGQAQRVALARALVLEPKVLLLDEPLASLDIDIRSEMQELILELKRNLGASLILVTHDQREASLLSDSAALFKDGRVLQIGTITQLLRHPQTLEVYRTMGGVNEIPGRISAGTFYSKLGNFLLPASHPIADGAVILVFRQEAAQFVNNQQIIGGEFCFTGRIEAIRKVGYRTELSVKIQSEKIVVESGDTSTFQKHQEIKLRVSSGDMCFLPED